MIKFHHYGLAVSSFEKSISFYSNIGYEFGVPIIDPLQNVELIMSEAPIGFPSIELIKPINEKSPINNYLIKNDPLIYHACYEIDGKDDFDRLFFGSKYVCVSKPKPAVLFKGSMVSFYFIKNIGLIEILQNGRFEI
jgi:hypothetical protein